VASHPILLLGAGDLADEVRGALDALEVDVVRLVNPTQREVADVFDRGPVERAVVVSGDDAFALRAALMVRHADAGVELLITYFDLTTADEMCARIGNCRVTSMADIVAPTLAGPVRRRVARRAEARGRPRRRAETGGDSVEEVAVDPPHRNRVRSLAALAAEPYDKSAALLLYGAVGPARDPRDRDDLARRSSSTSTSSTRSTARRRRS
jgi:hypothetical protein